MSPSNVQWPEKAYAAEGEDLSAPVRQLLIDLRLLEDPAPDETVTLSGGTPRSLQVITAGATSISKWVAGLVAGGGGLAALATGLNGFFGGVGKDGLDTELVRTAFILGGSLIGAAVVLALAMVARADVASRAKASAAQFDARAAVASALLTSFVRPPQPTVTPGYSIQKDNSWFEVEKFLWKGGQLVAKIDGDVVPMKECTGIVPS